MSFDRNHELGRLNAKYDFENQVRRMYDYKLYGVIQDTFCLLPLVCIVDKKICVLHGGLPEEKVTLSDLRK